MVTDPSERTVDRRRVLALSGVSIGALAGCAGDDDGQEDSEETPDSSDDQDPDLDGDTDDNDDREVDPSEALDVTIDAPDAGETGVRTLYDVIIENHSDETMVGDVEAIVDWPDGFEEQSWIDRDQQIAGAGDWVASENWVRPGSTGTLRLTVEVSLDTGETVTASETIEIGPIELDWGDSVRVATDQVISFGEPELLTEYDFENFSGETETHAAPGGEQFVFIHVEIANESDGSRTTPNRLSFELVGGQTQRDTMSRGEYERDDGYDGLNEVLDGVVEGGVLPFQMPSDLTRDDLRLVHSWTERETGIGWEIRVSE